MEKLRGRDRLYREFDELQNKPDINNCYTVDYWDPDNPDIFHWQVILIPPKGTDYEGGLFKLEVKFSEDYPNTPPKMIFLTKIFHCNISDVDGKICINTLSPSCWKPTYTMEYILDSIIIILYKQNPQSPINCPAADIYRDDRNKFNENLKKYLNEYANPNDFDNLLKQKIKTL